MKNLKACNTKLEAGIFLVVYKAVQPVCFVSDLSKYFTSTIGNKISVLRSL